MISQKNRRRVLGIAGFLASWETVFSLTIFDARLFPSLRDIVNYLIHQFGSSHGWLTVFFTLRRALVGFTIGAVIGILLGGIISISKYTVRATEFSLTFFRSLPGTALFPLFLLIVGIGHAIYIAIAAFITVRIVMASTLFGLQNIPPIKTHVAISYDIPLFYRIKDIYFPEAAPSIVQGLITTLSLSLRVSIVAEMFVGSTYGIGQRIYDAYLTYETVSLYSRILVAGIIGYLLFTTALIVKRKVLYRQSLRDT